MDISLLINNTGTEPLESEKKSDCKRKRNGSFDYSCKKARIEESDQGSDSEFSTISSRRSTATSISSFSSVDNTPSPNIDKAINLDIKHSEIEDPILIISPKNSDINSCEELIRVLSENCKRSIQLSKISFIDRNLPKMSSPASLTDEEETSIRQNVITQIHEKYVEPLLDITGYRWVRKEVPSKGRGVKVFSIKYSCSQQTRKNYKNANTSENNRSRHLSHPLKQYDCESLYSIKYIWSTQTVEVNYKHLNHSPYKRLPEKLKPFIKERLDMKALDLYHDILNDPQFNDIKHLIFFGKVQSYWSKERTKKKEQTTKEAFQQFFKS